jgi:REP element-mobilizing transposase RayT
MLQQPYVLESERRTVVMSALQKHCVHRDWNLLAAHLRSNHVHVVVEAEVPPEKIMNEFKAYASRELNRLGCDEPDRKRWARHGSTRWLWKDQDVRHALQYVIEEQGKPMALFVSEELQSPAPLQSPLGTPADPSRDRQEAVLEVWSIAVIRSSDVHFQLIAQSDTLNAGHV